MSDVLKKREILCPSCGGPTELTNPFVKLVVCSYCSAAITLTGDDAVSHGKAAQLADLYTDLTLGGAGELEHRQFAVFGRARFEYSDGFWDEWYVGFDDGTTAWLHEDEGELSLIALHEDHGVTSLASARVGHRFPVAGVEIFVKEKRTGKVVSAEGQLPRLVPFGDPMVYVDGQSKGALFMLEELNGEVSLFRGRRLADGVLKVY